MDEVHYLISDASKKVDVETHVLRYWEEELGLSIPRNELGHRYYTEFHIRLFCQVKKLKEKGYQLKAIKNALQQVMGPEQGQKVQRSMEPDRKIQEAASLLEQDIARTLQADPRLKGSFQLSLDKSADPGDRPGVARDLGPAITYLSDYSRLEQEAVSVYVGMGADPAPKAEKKWKEKGIKKKEEIREKIEDIEDIEGIEDAGYEEKVEKDGQADMKNKGKSRKKPSAWERRNGVVSGASTKGESSFQMAGQEGDLDRTARQEEILGRAIRREGAGKACVDRIIGRQEEARERGQDERAAELDGDGEEAQRSMASKEVGEKSLKHAILQGPGDGGTKSTAAKETKAVAAKEAGAVAAYETRAGAAKEAGVGGTKSTAAKETAARAANEVRAGAKNENGVGTTNEAGVGAANETRVRAAEQITAGESNEIGMGAEKETAVGAANEVKGMMAPAEMAREEAAVTMLAFQEDIEEAEKTLVPMTQEEKLEQFQMIMDQIIGKALEANNKRLSRDISRLVNDELVEELSDLMRIRDEREEERFRRLDETIRSCQRDRLGKAEAAATRIPFFRRKRCGRNGSALV